jgi:hypothetical protein
VTRRIELHPVNTHHMKSLTDGMTYEYVHVMNRLRLGKINRVKMFASFRSNVLQWVKNCNMNQARINMLDKVACKMKIYVDQVVHVESGCT